MARGGCFYGPDKSAYKTKKLVARFSPVNGVRPSESFRSVFPIARAIRGTLPAPV
jgi:hypothetical protein